MSDHFVMEKACKLVPVVETLPSHDAPSVADARSIMLPSDWESD